MKYVWSGNPPLLPDLQVFLQQMMQCLMKEE
jgi:hypothetical protein